MKILNKNFIDYIDYIKLENYRNSEALQLKYEIENYEEKQIKINIGDLASIFLIGKGNIDSEIYPKDLMDIIKDIINTFKEKPNLKYTIPTQTLKKLLNLVKVYRIDLYREYQTKVDSSISMGEDGACVYPLIANSNSIVILSDCLYYYRDNASSMTRMKKPLSWKNFEAVYELYEKEIELDRLNMRKQFYQSRVHNLFIIACSMFYVKESYKEITCRIKDEMSKPQNIDAIKNARFKNMKLRIN